MPDGTNLVYAYDGSFDGLMCCVFESYRQKEDPCDIRPGTALPNLFERFKTIETDLQKSERVYRSLGVKISPRVQEFIKLGFLTCVPQKELLIYRFLRLGFQSGDRVMGMLANDTVHALQKAVRSLTNESHKLMGFVRFSVYDKALVAVIAPQNYVLPLLARHFCDRLRGENFMIYDEVHAMALICQDGEAAIIDVDELTLPEPGEEEREYRRLWRQFYDTVAIRSRYNPRCRMTHMPKRYWRNLTELSLFLP